MSTEKRIPPGRRRTAASSRSIASDGKLSRAIIPSDWQRLLHNPITWDET